MFAKKKLHDLQAAAQAEVKRAREIAEKADGESRDLTDDERAEFDAAMTKSGDLLEQIKTVRRDVEIFEQAKELAAEIGEPALEDLEAQSEAPVRERVKSLGLQVVNSAQFKAAMAPYKGGMIPERARFQSDPIGVKGLFVGGTDTSAGAFVTAEQSGILEMLGRRTLRLRDLVSVRRTGSDTIEYVVQTAHTNAAAPVPEATSSAAPTATADTETGAVTFTNATGGGYKPEGSWAFERKSTSVVTIAEWVPATKRALADVAQLEGLINDELAADIAETEEAQMLSGDGTGENLTGILETSGLQAQSFSNDLFETIRKAITKARTVGRVQPNGILMSPEDAEIIDLARDDSGATAGTGGYLGGGPFGSLQRTVWGVPVIESEAIDAGTALLGDYSKAVLWDREQTTVTMTDSHADFFIRNMVAVLAEERVAFAVTRPTAFVTVDTVSG